MRMADMDTAVGDDAEFCQRTIGLMKELARVLYDRDDHEAMNALITFACLMIREHPDPSALLREVIDQMQTNVNTIKVTMLS